MPWELFLRPKLDYGFFSPFHTNANIHPAVFLKLYLYQGDRPAFYQVFWTWLHMFVCSFSIINKREGDSINIKSFFWFEASSFAVESHLFRSKILSSFLTFWFHCLAHTFILYSLINLTITWDLIHDTSDPVISCP